ncbi:MAG: hypothetical protein CMN60_20415 [Sphingobium sp.]|nr:hypothetical protein [Sphingobium sp.]|tara:strand:+ start:141 stop:701 length:561 start_codon:yes stop_codon:yes gene_type:complete
MKINQIITETTDNLFNTADDLPSRKAIANYVYDMLQKSYQRIGGLKGSGFASPEDMVNKIPFWKVFRRGSDIKAVMMYKDKNGRKRVATGSDGSDDAKAWIADQFLQDANGRSFAEISGPSLGFHKKTLGDTLDDISFTHDQVRAALPGAEIRPVPGSKYEYQRSINGEWITKRMVGKPGNKLFHK